MPKLTDRQARREEEKQGELDTALRLTLEAQIGKAPRLTGGGALSTSEIEYWLGQGATFLPGTLEGVEEKIKEAAEAAEKEADPLLVQRHEALSRFLGRIRSLVSGSAAASGSSRPSGGSGLFARSGFAGGGTREEKDELEEVWGYGHIR